MADLRPHVVILGGGFGGLYAAEALGGTDVRVTLVDKRNHHLFQPLLYQVATAALNTGDIAYPIRSVVRRHRNVDVLLAEARAVDPARKVVTLWDGELAYDYLVVATGATHSYFGRDDWARLAPGLKTIEDALEIRRRILTAFEAAERATDEGERRAWLTFVVVGAGATGVELAGALGEIARHTLERDFRHIDPSKTRVILVEGASRVLPPFPEDLSARAQAQLEDRGVEVRTDARVTGIDEHGVTVGDERIFARTVLWAAGVAASPLGRTLGARTDKAGRVEVLPDLSVPGHPEVFVVGDLARVEEGGALVPGVAPAAMQEGRHAAANVLHLVRGQPTAPFHYLDKGNLATIGRAAAVGTIGRLHLSGFAAWLVWAFVHIMYLIGFRNRLLVVIEWAWSYVTWQRGARLITGPPTPALEAHEEGETKATIR